MHNVLLLFTTFARIFSIFLSAKDWKKKRKEKIHIQNSFLIFTFDKNFPACLPSPVYHFYFFPFFVLPKKKKTGNIDTV